MLINDIEILGAKKDDIDAIMTIENQYGLEVYSKEEILKNIEDKFYKIYVAKLGNQIVGYIAATIIFEECNIIKIIVDNEYKRLRIASKLFDTLKNECQKNNVNHIYLEVRQDNDIAISFYKSLGFIEENIRKNYYGNTDAIIYGMNI